MTGDQSATEAPSLAPVQVSSVVDEVVDRLLTALALGEFLPGQRLPPTRELAVLLGVSRASASEAMARLKCAGVVDVRRGRSGGSFVRDSWNEASAGAVRRTLLPRRDELEQLCDLRCRYEETVARTAAERRTVVEAALLEQLLADFAGAGSPEQEHAADIALHEAVLAAAHNPAMTQLSHDLLSRVSIGMPIEPYDRAVFPQALAQHRALVEAVVGGDAQTAGTVARRHFSLSTRTLRAVMSRVQDDVTSPSR